MFVAPQTKGMAMGMFDYLKCKYPLGVDGANDILFQTKDTESQWMDLHEIGEDGSLWREAYDLEDHSDPNAEPGTFESILGCMTRVNKRWEPEPHTGSITFYAYTEKKDWYEFCALFKDGVLQSLVTVSTPN